MRFIPTILQPASLRRLPNVKGIIINGGPNNVVDGSPIDDVPELYEAGYLVMAADHASAACECSIQQLG